MKSEQTLHWPLWRGGVDAIQRRKRRVYYRISKRGSQIILIWAWETATMWGTCKKSSRPDGFSTTVCVPVFLVLDHAVQYFQQTFPALSTKLLNGASDRIARRVLFVDADKIDVVTLHRSWDVEIHQVIFAKISRLPSWGAVTLFVENGRFCEISRLPSWGAVTLFRRKW